MRKALVLVWLLGLVAIGRAAWGHGIGLEYDGTSILVNPGSESPLYTDQYDNPVPPNMFIDVWGAPSGGIATTDEGFAFASLGFPLNATYSFNVISPLIFSSGGVAVPANDGVYIDSYDVHPAGSGDYVASSQHITIDGSHSSVDGFQVNGNDPHELQKILHGYNVAGGNGDGIYGFAFNFTVTFGDGSSVTSGTLVDMYETYNFFVNNGGDAGGPPYFGLGTGGVTEEAALAVLAAVPEPSSLVLLAIGAAGVVMHRWRCRRLPKLG